jgi:hypothetical protein
VSKATIRTTSRSGPGRLVEAHREGQFLSCEVRRDVLEAYTAELLRRAGGKLKTSVA